MSGTTATVTAAATNTTARRRSHTTGLIVGTLPQDGLNSAQAEGRDTLEATAKLGTQTWQSSMSTR